MPSQKASKTRKKRPASIKRAPSKRTSAAGADLERLLGLMSEITAAAEKIKEAANHLSATAAGSGGGQTLASRSATRNARALGCLDILLASQIVQDAAGGPHNIDKKLLEIGFISDNERRVFQEDVFNGVLDAGCDINRGDIPNGANNTLRCTGLQIFHWRIKNGYETTAAVYMRLGFSCSVGRIVPRSDRAK
jgi:hypothetical protein